jgi:ribosomal-protein-alanine N-acetyltransferase
MGASRALHRPWITTAPATPEAFAQLLARSLGERHETLVARRLTDGAITGYLNISEIVRGPFQSAFLSYAAAASQAGQGYMSQALELTLAHAFGPLRLHRLEANIQPANTASIALVRGAGFVNEGFSERYLKVGGRWRDHERWALRVEQWRARRS